MVGLSFHLPTCLQNNALVHVYTLIVGVREYGEAAKNLEFNNLYQTLVSASGAHGIRFLYACALCIDHRVVN